MARKRMRKRGNAFLFQWVRDFNGSRMVKKIGNLIFNDPPLFLAPMAGISDRPFRLLCKRFGCDVVCSEMISAQALLHDSKRTFAMLEFSEEERPISIQLWGGDPQVMGEAAAVAASFGPDFIDINMGCPAPKIIKNKAGADLLRDLPRAGKIMSAVVGAVKMPVSIKIRSGWDENSRTCAELARMAQDAGVSFIVLHARTCVQQFKGRADWPEIASLKKIADIPVIGNGGVETPPDAVKMALETGCDGVMIGRGALGNPWLFRQIKTYRSLNSWNEPDMAERIKLALEHLDLEISYEQDAGAAVNKMRKHFAWYLKGFPGSAEIRRILNTLQTREEITILMSKINHS
ncbi:MAG: tRNA dihydrouridine synthase DusB [Bacillota bacterium]